MERSWAPGETGPKTDSAEERIAALRHEINNPLFVICGSAEAVQRRLQAAGIQDVAYAEELLPIVERILYAAEQIRRAVQATAESRPYRAR